MNLIKLSALQRRFWMDHQIKWPSAEYNETNYTFKIEGQLDIQRLHQTYRQLLEEYVPLRSRIQVVDNTPYFNFDDMEDVKVPFFKIELSTDPSIAVNQWVKKLVVQPFNLSKEYPCRFYALYDGKVWFLVNIFNHVVIDGPSLLLFFDRLSTIYNTLAKGKCEVMSLTNQITESNRDFDEKYKLEKKGNQEYWQNYLADADTHSFFHFNKKKQAQEKNSYPFCIGNVIRQKVETFCIRQGTTPYRLYSAVFAFALSKLTRNQQLLFDHTLNTRPKGRREIPGVYMNHLPLKFDFRE